MIRLGYMLKSFLALQILLFLVSFAIAQKESTFNPNGYNVFYYPSGVKSSEGNMAEGKPEGLWITYHENGKKKSAGNRVNHELSGKWSFYTLDEILLYEINYERDKKNGLSKTYDSLGVVVVEEVNYVDNVKHGDAFEYYSDGKLKAKYVYKDGNIDGKAIHYDTTGVVMTIRNYTGGFLRSEEKINRYDESGKKTGVWKEFYPDGKVKWEGNYKQGEVDGLVKQYNRDGGLKSMEKFVEGSIEEDSEETIFLELYREYHDNGNLKVLGGIKQDKKHGIFRHFDTSGVVLMTYIYKEGVKVAEGMRDSLDREQGNWKYYYLTGELQSEGVFQAGKKEGEWIFYYKDGVVQQQGKYLNNLPHGSWKKWYSNKQLWREESFIKGREEGEVIEYDSLGTVITRGEFVGGVREGKWFYELGDHKEIGEYRDGLPHGVWEHYFDDEKISFKGEFLNGIPINKHRYYHSNGKVKWEGVYKNGNKEGEWKKFDEDGLPVMSIFYKNGVEYKLDGMKIKPNIDIP